MPETAAEPVPAPVVVNDAKPIDAAQPVTTAAAVHADAAPAVHATEAAAPHADVAHSGHGATGHGTAAHGFDFDVLNTSHNQAYPAIEWVHGHPVLLLNAAEYAQINFARLSGAKEYASAKVDPDYATWAGQLANGASYRGVPAQDLAKAMTVARDESLLGSLPSALSFFNHQTFWSTIALVLTALVLLVFCRRKPEQVKPANRIQHVIEALVLFVRDDIVRPSIKHNADAWTPFFASLFMVILTCNVFSLVPLFATATGNLAVTAVWSLSIGVLMLFMGIKNNGPVRFWITLVPVPWSWNPLGMALWFFLFVLEVAQLVIRPTVLAMRLCINLFAGHSVLLVFACLGFIIVAGDHSAITSGVAMGIAGWVLTVILYFLELLVAVLQAFIFTMLSAVFIGLCAHPEH